jgi:aminoglycoside 6'-N-acetyltransferase
VIDDEPEYARQLQVDPGAVGIDLFIGEAWARNRGLGSPVLRAFLDQVVFGEMGAQVAIIAPEPANARAIRAYEKAGFQWVKTVHVIDEESPVNTGDEYVMRLTRASFRLRG